MAKSKWKLSDIGNEYKKQNECYRQTIKELNEAVCFLMRSYSSLTYKYKGSTDDKVSELQASFILGFVLGVALSLLLKLFGGV